MRALLLVLVASLAAAWWLTGPGSGPGSGPGAPASASTGSDGGTGGARLDVRADGSAERSPVGEEGVDPDPAPSTAAGDLRLVDATVGDPVPWITVEVGGERRTSDADGWLHDVAPVAGPVQPVGPDDRLPGVGASGWDGVGRSLALAVGPTFRIEAALPAGRPRADFEVALLSRHPTMALAHGLLSPGPLRETDGVLWHRESAPIDDLGPWELELRTSDHLFTGRAAFERPAGLVDVAIVLEGRGGIDVTLSDEDGTVADAVVLLRALDPGNDLEQRSFLPRGRRTFGGLRTGRYALEASSPRHVPHEREVLVVPAEIAKASLTLERVPIAGEITGTVDSSDGTYHAPMSVELVHPETGTQLLRVPVVWVESTPDRRWSGTFRFAAVPAGEWELRPDAPTWHRFTPPTSRLVPPARAALHVDDAGVERGLGFHVRDAVTDGRLDGFIAHFEGESGAYHRIHGTRSGMQVLPTWIEGAPLRWRIELPGYRAAEGTEDDFVEPGDDGRSLYARVALERERP